jgi:hypothetical protein
LTKPPTAPSLEADLMPEISKPIEIKDLNLQTQAASPQEIKNIVDLLSVPHQESPTTEDSPAEDLNEERPYLKLNPDIASDTPPKDNSKT